MAIRHGALGTVDVRILGKAATGPEAPGRTVRLKFVRNLRANFEGSFAEKAVIEVTALRFSISSRPHDRTYPKSGHAGKSVKGQ